jgi:hypothetical protein
VTTGRRLHFVGTMPQFDDPDAALKWQLSELDGQVRRLCGGETGPRLLWLVPMIKDLKGASWTRAVRHGDWTGYDDVDRLTLRPGTRLTARDIPLKLAEWAREELTAAGEDATADRPLQIGIPCYLDMALFTFGPTGLLRHTRPFLDAVAAQIDQIVSFGGDRVVFQLEAPTATIAVTATPRPARPLAADLMARLVTRQVVGAPRGTRFGVHLCLGDLGHRAMRQLRSADPVVRLANAVQRHWPAGRTLEFLHLPLSGGDRPPTTDPAFYAPLLSLGRRAGTTVVAGIAHESQSPRDQLAVRTLVEQAVGHEVDIATACGLGRRTPGQAALAVDRMRALLD